MWGKNEKKRKLPILCTMAITALASAILWGCSVEESGGSKVADVEYEIVEEKDIPEELAAQIEEKKAADFKLSYEKDGTLYIVRGYGEQATGGYSIRMKACYLTSNALLFDTELIGPRKGENAAANPSYPYIVIKTVALGKNIIFE
jgi:hypothetical protein